MEQHIHLLTKAADFAARAHRDHRRKDAQQTPYINHLTEVARLLAGAGCDVTVVTAGYLHDTIEDVEVTYEELVDAFGIEVANLVRAVTDDRSLPKSRRKELQVEHAAHASAEVAALKLADKISNLSSLRDAPPAGWSEDRIFEYLEWAHRVVTSLPEPNPILLERYQSLRAELLNRQ